MWIQKAKKYTPLKRLAVMWATLSMLVQININYRSMAIHWMKASRQKILKVCLAKQHKKSPTSTQNPVPAADVTIEYVDLEGNEIHSSQTISGNVGDSYDTSADQYKLSIDGYSLDESQLPENSKGVFGETAQTITYIYKKILYQQRI